MRDCLRCGNHFEGGENVGKRCLITILVVLAIGLTVSCSDGERFENDVSQETKEIPSIEENTDDKETNQKESAAESELREEETPEDLQGGGEKGKYSVGDTWKNRYALVSYDGCGEYFSDNPFIQPVDGNKFIYATFTFENIGDSDISAAYWDFNCYADGYACKGIYMADDAGLAERLSSRRKISMSVYFEVPVNSMEIEFEYSPSFWTSEKVVFVYEYPIMQDGYIYGGNAKPDDYSGGVEEYLLPESNTRYLTEWDIAGFSSSELRIAKNEIYARHGRMFTSEDLNLYFNSKSWYQGTVAPENFSESVFSQVEKENILFIQKHIDSAK